jgi:hypothetical protein
MITDDELAQLPDDPELAFVEFERIMRARLDEAVQRASQEKYGDTTPYRVEYVNRVVAAAKQYNIEELVRWAQWKVPFEDDQIFRTYYEFTTDVDRITMQIRIRNAPHYRKNTVGLDGNSKTKIHHHIEQIRRAIEQAELPDTKRDALYQKLNSFALEVDKARTSLEAGMAVYIAVCDGIGQGFKKLEPARRLINSIAELLGRAKEVEDSLRPPLPPPEERRRLEAPRQQLPSPASKAADLDDEIPF